MNAQRKEPQHPEHNSMSHEEPNDLTTNVATLTVTVKHIQDDIKDIKADIKEVKSDQRRFEDKVERRFDHVNELINADFKAIREMIHSAKIWAVLLYVALGVGLLCVMARGFKWI